MSETTLEIMVKGTKDDVDKFRLELQKLLRKSPRVEVISRRIRWGGAE